MASFPGLAHRMEQVGRIGRVLFVNDSKATNADAAEKALLSFRDIFWIVGGKAKEGGIEPLRPLFPRVAKAYLIGAASEDFAAHARGRRPVRALRRRSTTRVAAAARDARRARAAEPVVLLSPACASYDQFANFEARGDASARSSPRWSQRTRPSQTNAEERIDHDFESRARPRRRLVPHRRSLAARLVRRADGDRRRDGARREPGGRRAAQSLDLPFRQPAGRAAGRRRRC